MNDEWRRQAATSAAFGLLCALCNVSAVAQSYPSRPVRVIVPYPAGGSLDLIGRVYAKALGDSLGQPFIVDNRGGANGNVGTEVVANAAPDGYTLVITSSSNLTINPNI